MWVRHPNGEEIGVGDGFFEEIDGMGEAVAMASMAEVGGVAARKRGDSRRAGGRKGETEPGLGFYRQGRSESRLYCFFFRKVALY